MRDTEDGSNDWAGQVKERIRRRYTRLAEGGRSPTGGAPSLLAAGYSAPEIARLPAPLADLYTGCGHAPPSADLRNVETALDIGAGAGIDALLLVDRLPAIGRVIALDLTPAMLRGVRELHPRIDPVAADMEALPLAAETVDLVTANAAFNLAADKARAFAEAFRVLKPGGRLAARDLVRHGALPPEVREDPLADVTSLGGTVEEATLAMLLEQARFADIAIGDHRAFSYVISVRVEAQKPERRF